MKTCFCTPVIGKCPRNALLLSKMLSCKYDYVGCKFDSQCEGSEKCCQSGCGYRECQAPKTRVRTTSSPQICTLLSCGPEPGPECRSKKLVRPNGPGCGPQCAVCEDDPVEPVIMNQYFKFNSSHCQGLIILF